LTSVDPARIRIDPDREIGEVDARVYGGFIEHLGRCIYGGIFDEGSPLSDEYGFRRDVLAALRELQPTVLRWPGGLFANGYHWQDGVGPRDMRPRRIDVAWGAEESNRFGTDEFIAYCRALGCEPVICINMGTGTVAEAQAWVEYCNGHGDTHWANLRRRHGVLEPHAVKYWALGNEMYGWSSIGSLGAEDYVKKAIEFATVMKRTDPNIQLIGCGMNGWSRWDRVVLEGLASIVDFFSLHIYSGSEDYYTNVLAPHQAERALTACEGLITAVRYQQQIEHSIHVAYDEWNVWYHTGNPPWPAGTSVSAADGLEERYTLADALAVATYFNVFIRKCRTVRMANLAQMVNVLAPIITTPDGLVQQTSYHVFALYSRHMRGHAVDVHVAGEMHELGRDAEISRWPHRVADLGPFTMLDAVAVKHDTRNQLTLAVVNRSLTRDITASISIVGSCSPYRAQAWQLGGADVNASNSVAQPTAVLPLVKPSEIRQGDFDYSFPAHSLTLLELNGRD
jgi:alpha-N-arabinofuranosidase